MLNIFFVRATVDSEFGVENFVPLLKCVVLCYFYGVAIVA